MSYPYLPLDGWYERSRAGFRRIVGAAVDVWPNSWAVVAKVLALLALEIDQRVGWLFRQIFVSTADPTWLRRHAFEYGITERAAARASGTIIATCTSTGTIPAGLVLQRLTDGALFTTTAPVIVSAPGDVSVPVQANTVGLGGNTDAGVYFNLVTVSPVTITVAVSPAGGIGGGAEAEDIEDLRQRVLARRRQPPQGGSASDWIAWARAVPGVDRVWVDSFSNTDRRVWVAFTFEDRANGIPTSGDVAVVQAALDNPAQRPVTARVTAVGAIAWPVNVTATNVAPLTTTTIAAINAELQALFAERMDIAKPNSAFILPRAWISEAISRAIGEDRHTLTLPASDLTISSPGLLPVLGTVNLS